MTVLLLAVALYLIATALLVRALARGVDNPHGWTIPALLAVLFHAGFHVDAWQSANGLDMHFFAALSLVGRKIRRPARSVTDRVDCGRSGTECRVKPRRSAIAFTRCRVNGPPS